MWLILTLIGLVAFVVYKFILSPSNDFWGKYGVNQINKISQLDRVFVFLGKQTSADLDEIIYKEMGKSRKQFCGTMELGQPIFLVRDLEIVKKVLIKDFEYFVDRRHAKAGDNQKIINQMLVNLKGEEWKGVRTALSPTFTTGKIRRMMESFNKVSLDWISHLKEKVNGEELTAINLEKETINFTVETISAAVFGMNSGTIRNPEALFAQMVHRLNHFDWKMLLKAGIAINFPKVMNWLNISFFNDQVINFFVTLMKQNVESRKSSKVQRNDFLQLLLEASKGDVKGVGTDEMDNFEKDAQIKVAVGGKKKNCLEDEEIINAAMLQFFFAGFSTTSNFIGFTLYALALNPEVQSKLREELNSQLFKNSEDEIDYDELVKLQYLDMVVSEVLRKFPALLRLERKCLKDYKGALDGVKVPKGAVAVIPVQAIHNDPELYQFPDKFWPEHFSPENKAKRSPYAFLSFGTGPRNCIGMRFALIEGKAAIAHVVHNFILEPTEKTPIPLKVKPIGISQRVPDNLEIGLRLAKE